MRSRASIAKYWPRSAKERRSYPEDHCITPGLGGASSGLLEECDDVEK